MLMAHVMAVRSAPVHEIREVVVPAVESAARVQLLARTYETVFVSRTFWSRQAEE